MDAADLAAAGALAARFARAEVEPRRDAIESDARLAREVLHAAARLGIAAGGGDGSPDAGGGGALAWGSGGPDAALAVALIEPVAAACAGTAVLVLAQGLASCATGLCGLGPPPGPVAFGPAGAGVVWGASVAAEGVWFDEEGGEVRLFRGAVTPAEGWLGLRAGGPGARSGNRQVIAAGAQALAAASRTTALAQVGAAAVAAGLGRGALEDARRYAAERFQGGDLIGRLGVVRAILARAACRVAGARLVAGAAAARGGSAGFDADAAAAFVVATEGAVEATTGCLQVFGGYGYMADMPMEKRWRDAHALRSALGPSARALRALEGDVP